MSDEPTPPPGEEGPAFAAYWRRAVAFVLDALIVGALSAAVYVAFGGDLPTDTREEAVRFAIVGLGVGLLYLGVLNGSPRGQTAGKTALRIRVRDAETGGPIGLSRGLLRFGLQWLLFQLAYVPGVVDSLWPLFDPARQSFHDKAARSVVVDVVPVSNN